MEIRENVILRGTVTLIQAPNLPVEAVGGSQIKTSDPVPADRAVHRQVVHYSQADGSDVVAAIVPVHVAAVDGLVKSVEVVCLDCPQGGDKHFTVDVLVASEGVAPASILDAPIDCQAGETDATVLDGVVEEEDYVAGQTLIVQVAVAGSTGNQGQGLVVTITLDENPV